MTRYSIFLQSCLFIICFVVTFPACSQPALPNDKCKIPPHKIWTEQEKWVWTQICEGKPANLAKRYPCCVDNPEQSENWPLQRTLRPFFLESILLFDPWRTSIPRQGIHIRGAKFDEPVDLTNAFIQVSLTLEKCSIDSLNMNGIESKGNLTLDESLIKNVYLKAVNIAGELSLEKATITETLNIDSGKINQSIFLGQAHLAEVILRNANIGVQLSSNNIEVTKKLMMDDIEVKHDVFLNHAKLAETILAGTNIGGGLNLEGSVVDGKLNMDSVDVKKSVNLRGVHLAKEAELRHISVGGNLDLSEGEFHTIDLTGAHIGHDFRLGSTLRKPPIWDEKSELILRNVSVDSIQDNEDDIESLGKCLSSGCPLKSWPKHIELDGFKLNQVGGIGENQGNEILQRPSEWWVQWLARDEPYSPQTYQMLADALHHMGKDEVANELMYASKNAELGVISSFWYKSVLFLSWCFIGYGYYWWRSLIWVFVFSLLGAIFIRCSCEKQKVMNINNYIPPNNGNFSRGLYCWLNLLAYSFDMLLPIIRLRDKHYCIDLTGRVRYYFYFHRIIGWVLGGFMVYGVTSLIQ